MANKQKKSIREQLLLAKNKENAKNDGQDSYLAAVRRFVGGSSLAQKKASSVIDYARQGEQNVQDIANTLTSGAMSRLDRGDVGSLDRDTIYRATLDNAAIKEYLSGMGIFDSKGYATDKAYVTLPSSSYLKQLEEQLQMQRAGSIVQDDFARASKDRWFNTRDQWHDMFNRLPEMNENNEQYFWTYADWLLGDRGSDYDINAYNAQWDEMSDDDFFAEQDRLRKQFEGLKWDELIDDQYPEYTSQTPTYDAYLKTVNSELTRRKTIDELESIAKANPDYGTLSVYSDTYVQPERNILSAFKDETYAMGLDDQNRFMNIRSTWAEKEVAAEYSGAVSGYLAKGYDYLTDEELANYNVLYNMDQAKAAAYLEALGDDLLYRRAQAMRSATEVQATNGWLAVPSWIAAGINTLGNIGALPLQMYQAATGKDNPYSAAYDAANQAAYVTDAQMEALGDIEALQWSTVFGRNLAQHIYGGLSSARDNAIRLAASGGNPLAAAGLAGAQAASGSLQESAERNDMSGAAKIVKALLTAGAEVGTEKIGLDALFDRGKRDAISYIKGVISAELGEETVNYLSEDAIEAAVAFMFDHEADIKTAPEFWQGLGETAIQTIISSGLMGSGGAITQTMENRSTGKTVQKQGDPEAVLSIGESMGEDTQSYAIAKDIRAKLGKGGKVSTYQLGRLTRQLEAELSEEHSRITNQVMDDAIAARLMELGDDAQTAKKNAPVVRKVSRGQDSTAFERASVKWNDNASQVVKELAREVKSEGDAQRTGMKWQTDMTIQAVAQTGEVQQKKTQLRDAVTTPKSSAVKEAEAKAEQITKGRKSNRKNLTATKVAYAAEDGAEKSGDFKQFVKDGGEIRMVINTDDGEQTVAVSDMTNAEGKGTATIIEYTTEARNDMSAEEANALMKTYQAVGGDVGQVIEKFDQVYAAGYAGIDMPTVNLPDNVKQDIYAEARKDSAEAEEQRIQRTKAARSSSKGVVTWLGKVTSNDQVTGSGSEEALSGALEVMTESQRSTVEGVKAIAQAAKVNIVLFESDLTGEEKTQNGSYHEGTNTIYLDINSGVNDQEGASVAKKHGTLGYAMMRTLSHELTHYIEAGSADGYANLKAAMKQQLKERGQDWATLVRGKLENAAVQHIRLTRAGAEAEVVADASEYMLENSAAIEKLGSGLKDKIKGFVQDFLQRIRTALGKLVGGHAESRALRQQVDGVNRYVGELQKLWDVALEETVKKADHFNDNEKTEPTPAGGIPSEGKAQATHINSADNSVPQAAGNVNTEIQDSLRDEVEAVRFSIRDGSITTESTEEERYEVLKDAILTLAAVDESKLQDVDLSAYNTRKKSDVEKGIRALAKMLGITNVDLTNSRIDFPFTFTNKNLGKSLHHQLDYGGTYQDYVKAMSCFDEIVENAIPIETHNDKKAGTKKVDTSLRQVYVLLSAFQDSEGITPVQLEIKEFWNNANQLYLTVALTKITPGVVENGLAADGSSVHSLFPGVTAESEVVGNGLAVKNGSYHSLFSGTAADSEVVEAPAARNAGVTAPLFPESTISLRALIENVNSNDYKFFKYVPDGFLNEEQKAAKRRALAEQEREYESYSQMSLRDLPEEESVREFIAESGDEVASNIEEKNALAIYRKRLDDFKAAVKETEAAEKARDDTIDKKGHDSIDAAAAQNVVNIKRMHQKKAYNDLLRAEDTPHVKQVLDFARQFIHETVSGTAEDFANRQAEADAQLKELEAQYEELRAAGRTQMAAERKRSIELQQRYMRTIKSRVAEGIKERRAEYERREANARDYRHVRDEVDKLRRSIGRKVKRLNALRVRETDQKHVPEELKPMVDAVMTVFTENAVSKLAFSNEQAARLSRTYDALRRQDIDETYYWDEEISETLKTLMDFVDEYNVLKVSPKGKTLSYFTVEGVQMERLILTGVEDVVSNVLKMVDTANEEFINGKKTTFEAYATQTGESLLQRKDAKLLKGWMGDAQKILDEWMRTGNMTPVYFIEHLDNPLIQEVFDQIRRGQSDYAKIIAECQTFVQETKAKYHYGSWVGDAALKMKTSQGHEITLNREQAMWVYATANREESNKLYQTEHLLYGGFQYKDTRNIGEGKTRVTDMPHLLNKADISKISDWLTDEQRAYADAMVKYLSTVMAEYGNDASMAMFGYKKFLESYYFPFKVRADQRFLRGDEGAGGEDAGTGRLKHASFTNKIQDKANQTLVMDDFTAVVADHMQRMATYSAMVQPIENLKRLLNHKVVEKDGGASTIRALIGRKYGQATQDYMTALLKDLNGAAQGDNRATKGVDFFINAFKRGAVMASASVVLQQPTAMARAMAMVNFKYFMTNPFYRPGKGVWDEMMKHSGTAVIKDMGKFDVGLGLTASEYISDEHLKPWEAYRRLKAESKLKGGAAAYKSFMGWLTAAPGKADQWTWGLIWQAVKKETAAQNPGMDTSSEAFLDLVGQRFDDVIDHTQVYDSVLTRSNLMRSKNALHKMATSFMSEPTLSINMLYNALNGEHSGKKRAAIIGSVMASQVLAGALAALVQAWNDDKDERNWLEKYADRATGNILDNINVFGMVPYISDFISLCQGYEVERADMSAISTLIKYTTGFWDKLYKGETLTLKDWENFAGNWANLTGIPAKNIMREIRRTINAVTNTDWSAPNMSNVGYAIKENLGIFYSSKNSAYYERLVSAMLEGDAQLVEDYREYMLTSKMVSEEKLAEGLRGALKDEYQRGRLTKDQARDFLLENNLAEDRQRAFTYVDKWDEEWEGDGSENYSHSVYNSVRTAIDSGSKAEITAAIKELTDNGWAEDSVATAVRSYVKDSYIENRMTQSQVRNMYKSYCLPTDFDPEDENDWYWLFKELDYYKQNGADASDWKKYGALYSATETGNNLKAVVQEYLNHGVEKGTLSNCITTHYKQQMIDLRDTGKRTELANLQTRILTVYQVLGYDRDKKLKDIQKWLEE